MKKIFKRILFFLTIYVYALNSSTLDSDNERNQGSVYNAVTGPVNQVSSVRNPTFRFNKDARPFVSSVKKMSTQTNPITASTGDASWQPQVNDELVNDYLVQEKRDAIKDFFNNSDNRNTLREVYGTMKSFVQDINFVHDTGGVKDKKESGINYVNVYVNSDKCYLGPTYEVSENTPDLQNLQKKIRNILSSKASFIIDLKEKIFDFVDISFIYSILGNKENLFKIVSHVQDQDNKIRKIFFNVDCDYNFSAKNVETIQQRSYVKIIDFEK